MHVLILMRIFTRIRMLDGLADRLRFLNHPRTFTFLQIIGNLHARARRCASLGAEYNFRVRLIAIDGNGSNVHFHGAHIKSAHAVEVLLDSGANGVVFALLLLASAAQQECGGKPQNSISMETGFGKISFLRAAYCLGPMKAKLPLIAGSLPRNNLRASGW